MKTQCMPDLTLIERNQRIIALRNSGKSWKFVARSVDLTISRCCQIYWKQRRTLFV